MIFLHLKQYPQIQIFVGTFAEFRGLVAKVNTYCRETYFLYIFLKSLDAMILLRSQQCFDKAEPHYEA